MTQQIELQPVIGSSNVTARAYDPISETLWVQFKGTDLYEYQHVPVAVWEAFCAAPSAGSFVWSHLRDRFPYRRVR